MLWWCVISICCIGFASLDVICDELYDCAWNVGCCSLPTTMTLASGGSQMFPFVVHQPVSPSIWPAVQSLRRCLSTNPGVTMWCVSGCSCWDAVCRVCGCYRGGIVVMDVFWRRLCVSVIWGRKICLFWVGHGCDEWGGEVSTELLMCGGGVRSILLLPLVARCLETIDVCVWRMFVFMSLVVTVWGSVGMFVV